MATILINASNNSKKIKNTTFKWKLLLSPNQISAAFIDPNIKNFGETQNIEFTSNPLQQFFEYPSFNDFIQKVKEQSFLL